MKWFLLGLVLLAPCVLTLRSAVAQEAAPPIRYLDMTARTDGWGASQLAAAQASKNSKVVIISYLDPQTTRALYDAAVPFTRSPTNLPIVGLIRSPAAPPNVTTTPNLLGFDVFFNGSTTPPPKPDSRFTRTDELATAMRVIHRTYFAATPAQDNGCFDIEREPDPATGGLRIPRQRVCPTGKLPSP